MSLLNIYEKFIDYHTKYQNEDDKLSNWLYDNFLKLNTLLKIKNNYKILKGKLYNVFREKITGENMGIKFFKEVLDFDVNDRIMFSLIMGLRLYTAVKNEKDDSYGTQFAKDKKIKLSRMSFLVLKGKYPRHVLYNELFIMMGKSELNIVSEIPRNVMNLLG